MPRSTRRPSGQRRRQVRRPELHPRPAASPASDGGPAPEPRERAGATRPSQRQAAPGPQARPEAPQPPRADPLLAREMRRIGLLAGGVLLLLVALALVLR